MESSRNNLKLIAPWTAITATVVGVILNLAIFFGVHVLWPQGFSGSFDFASAGLAAIAALLLFYYQRNIILVIVGCSLLGLLLKLIMS